MIAAGAGGVVWTFFFSSFILSSLGYGPIQNEILSQWLVKNKTTKTLFPLLSASCTYKPKFHQQTGTYRTALYNICFMFRNFPQSMDCENFKMIGCISMFTAIFKGMKLSAYSISFREKVSSLRRRLHFNERICSCGSKFFI